MRLLNKKAIFLAIITAAIFLIFCTIKLFCLKTVSIDNKLSEKKRQELNLYFESINHENRTKHVALFAINEGVCSSNLILLKKTINELNPTFIGVIVNSPNAQFYQPISDIVRNCKKLGIPVIIDKQDNLSNIYSYIGYPLIIFLDGSRVTDVDYLKHDNYEETIERILDFVVDGK